MSTAAQIKAIHAIRRRSGMAEEDYRALLKAETGATSSRDLSTPVAAAFIDTLQRVGGRPAAATASGPYAPVLQALWIAAWNLALVRSKDDRAMMRFVERQTGLSHTRFLREAADASRAIEALKAWMARDGGVAWPKSATDIDRKRAVCHAIAARLQAVGAFTPLVPGTDIWPPDVQLYGSRRGLPAAFADYGEEHWDRLANQLGARLRGHLAAQEREAVREAAHA